MSTTTTDAQHSRAIARIINDHVHLERETNVRITDHIEAYFTDNVSRARPAGSHMMQLTQELEHVMKELEGCRAVLTIVTRERDTGSTNYSRVCKERDQLKKDLGDQVDRLIAAGRASEAKVHELLTELTNLRDACVWIKFSDRKPTIEDADMEGMLCCMGADGSLFLNHIETISYPTNAMWRPTNSPVPIPPFVRWKRTLTPSQIQDFGDLDEVWKSINKFIAENQPGRAGEDPVRGPSGDVSDERKTKQRIHLTNL